MGRHGPSSDMLDAVYPFLDKIAVDNSYNHFLNYYYAYSSSSSYYYYYYSAYISSYI